MIEKEELERYRCPGCGILVSEDDVYCRKCGAILETAPPPGRPSMEEAYYRRFSVLQRFRKILRSPSEALKDIAFAPDYEGVLIVLAMEFIIVSATFVLVRQKLHLSGPHAAKVSSMLTSVLFIAVLIAVIVYVVKWLIKSLIVRYVCDSGSGWDFKTAASITGYAYVADLVMGIIGICLGWLLVPPIHLDFTNREAMRQAVADYQAQFNWLKLIYTLPFSLLGLLWKSYLGGLGARFGTKEKCSFGLGFLVFFLLGLVSLLLSFIL